MIEYPKIDPEIVKIGPFSIRWYGLMYLFGFLSSYLLTIHQIKKNYAWIKREAIENLYFYLILGLIIGARLGYIIFYNLQFYLKHPLEIFMLWHGGMSFHGGLIGAIIAGYIFMKKENIPFFLIADIIIPSCPIGLGLGRIGNFINGELYGRVSDLPWAMIFPRGGDFPRHPSQLYEAFFEGFLLFVILWLYKDKKRFDGDLFTLFLIFYGVFRTFCEFFREPDGSLILSFFTKGQILSILMIITGIFLRYYLKKSQAKEI
ncbi:MAG: prolipoprotein diacylglyceryl transferase [Deltaproteobacteria bacterium]|nr:prolipoprotein diacylglyceryl transferase [Deltaproteobacteria bacterium]